MDFRRLDVSKFLEISLHSSAKKLAYIDGRGPAPHILIPAEDGGTNLLIGLIDSALVSISDSQGRGPSMHMGELRQEVMSNDLCFYPSYQAYASTRIGGETRLPRPRGIQ